MEALRTASHARLRQDLSREEVGRKSFLSASAAGDPSRASRAAGNTQVGVKPRPQRETFREALRASFSFYSV